MCRVVANTTRSSTSGAAGCCRAAKLAVPGPSSQSRTGARVVEAPALARISPCMETIEDFRASTASADQAAQPILPPALQSLEAFKTRRSFLNGQLGLDSSAADSAEDSGEDGTGDETAWLQASELSDLCNTDLSNASPLLRSFCQRMEQEKAMQLQHPHSAALEAHLVATATSAVSDDDTDEEGDIY